MLASHEMVIRLLSLKIIPEAYDDADLHLHPRNTHDYSPLPHGRKEDGMAHPWYKNVLNDRIFISATDPANLGHHINAHEEPPISLPTLPSHNHHLPPPPTNSPKMRFTAPIIALAASLPLLTTAQMGPDDTICGFLYGTDYTDACCHTVISRGVNAPCTDIEYVSNLTECSTYHYPTGWAVCVEKVWYFLVIPKKLCGRGS